MYADGKPRLINDSRISTLNGPSRVSVLSSPLDRMRVANRCPMFLVEMSVLDTIAIPPLGQYRHVNSSLKMRSCETMSFGNALVSS
jgi:hypothetical protein